MRSPVPGLLSPSAAAVTARQAVETPSSDVDAEKGVSMLPLPEACQEQVVESDAGRQYDCKNATSRRVQEN